MSSVAFFLVNYLEINFFIPIIFALIEESVNYSVSQGIDRKFWDSDEILPGQVSLVCLVQTLEPIIKPLYLRPGEARLF